MRCSPPWCSWRCSSCAAAATGASTSTTRRHGRRPTRCGPSRGALLRVSVVRVTRVILGLTVAAVALLLPQMLSVDRSLKASAVLIYALVGLSLVVLTGWAGQVSLGQVGFFALGAALGAKATLDWGLDLSLALVLTAAAGAVVAIVVGLPALRSRGFYLAVTTLAFSLAATSYLLRPSFFDWIPTERVPRPPLFGRIDIDSASGIYYLVLGVLVLTLIALNGVRHSRSGRAMLALRDNERGAQAYGLSATRVRLMAFAMSGAIASMAGCLLAHHQQAYDPSLFTPADNLVLFTMVVVGGVASPMGAILGALYLQGCKWFLPAQWQLLASGGGVLLVLLLMPGGLGGLVFSVRDRLLRFVARRWNVDAPGFVAAAREAPDDHVEPIVEAAAGDALAPATTGRPLLEVRGLDVHYGSVQVLFGVDLRSTRAAASRCSARTAPASRRC